MVLTAPADAGEMNQALQFALGQARPVVIRYPKDLVPADESVQTATEKPFELGKSIVVQRGRKPSLAIVCYGSVLAEGLKASDILSSEKISTEVINARFAAPIDERLISLLSTGKSLITVEDHYLSCGFGSAVLEMAATEGCDLGNIRVLAAPRCFIGHDSRSAQLIQAGINAEEIAKTARELMANQGSKGPVKEQVGQT